VAGWLLGFLDRYDACIAAGLAAASCSSMPTAVIEWISEWNFVASNCLAALVVTMFICSQQKL
jgi:hypothetical protein